jgi:hypothetical protein
MGVTVHYSGKLADPKQVKAVCKELTAIALKMNWDSFASLDEDSDFTEFTVVGPEYETPKDDLALTGIELEPHPDCETFILYFDQSGKLCHPMIMSLISEGYLKPEDMGGFVKTQYAGAETHFWIVGLLKYLQIFHLPDLQVVDEGYYWETGDVEMLEERMGAIDAKSPMISNLLGTNNAEDIYYYSPDKIACWFAELIGKPLSEAQKLESKV